MPETLLQDVSPYRTRRASLVRGDDDTYLYLEDITGASPRTISAVWVGNGTPAPTRSEVSTERGAPARMLARGTRHPDGCPALTAPRIVWFEEGDGMALVDGDETIAVVPGWAGTDGFYGYSRWAVGRSPLAWELEGEAAAMFAEKVARSASYWNWRLAPAARAWDEIRSDGLEHLTRRLGPAENVQEVSGRFPELVVSRHRAGTTDVWVTATTGLSGARMAGVERHVDDPSPVSRVELALARDRPDAPGAELLAALAGIPFGRCTWFGDGHTIGGSPGAFPDLGPDCVAVLLTTTPPGHPPDLSGVERRGDPVRYLWVVGLDAAGFRISRARGAATTIARLADSGRTWVQRTVSPPVERF
ncbi:MAG: suppressor of fused domain protein [Acidimicrobiales bacterium]|nr:suppressor of fused domain protein [Acidimicrobiales bacterium]